VKYYLCEICDRVPPGYAYDRTLLNHKLFVADRAVPRVVVVGRVAGLYDRREEFPARLRAVFDPFREVLLDRSVAVPGLADLVDTPADALHAVVKQEARSLNAVEVSVSSDRPAIVVLNEYFTDAWNVSINGIGATTIKVNLNQVGVAIPAGGSVVRFEYRPALFIWLLRVQRMAVLIVLAVGGAYAWRRARSRIVLRSSARA